MEVLNSNTLHEHKCTGMRKCSVVLNRHILPVAMKYLGKGASRGQFEGPAHKKNGESDKHAIAKVLPRGDRD